MRFQTLLRVLYVESKRELCQLVSVNQLTLQKKSKKSHSAEVNKLLQCAMMFSLKWIDKHLEELTHVIAKVFNRDAYFYSALGGSSSPIEIDQMDDERDQEGDKFVSKTAKLKYSSKLCENINFFGESGGFDLLARKLEEKERIPPIGIVKEIVIIVSRVKKKRTKTSFGFYY